MSIEQIKASQTPMYAFFEMIQEGCSQYNNDVIELARRLYDKCVECDVKARLEKDLDAKAPNVLRLLITVKTGQTLIYSDAKELESIVKRSFLKIADKKRSLSPVSAFVEEASKL